MIIERLNELYQRQAEVKQALSHEPWFPRASGCGGCLREMAHLAAGYRRRAESGDSLRTFELGHQRGEALERLAKEVWPDAETQIEVRIPLPGCSRPMVGHLDLWIPSLRTIVDFKTTGSFKAGLLLEGKEGPGEEYEMQLQAYRWGVWRSNETWAPRREDIRCLLVFEAKDTDARKGVRAGQLIEVEVPHTAELEQRFQARLQALGAMMRAREDGSLDPTTFDGKPKDHWKCRMDKNNRPLYCGIGPIIGKCHELRISPEGRASRPSELQQTATTKGQPDG